jgi:TDG/mug DNA glycosylase family protein
MSAARGHHFARPGNRFWPALHGAGFTPRLLSPEEDRLMLEYGLGITNLVDRPTRAADELSADELKAGAEQLADLAREYEPAVVAVVGWVTGRCG